jgi:N-methylhydantoinase A
VVFREGGRIEPFNFTVPTPEPFIPKALTFEIPERMMASGQVFRPLDRTSARQQSPAEESGVEASRSASLWSIVNARHELEMAELLDRHLPGVPYTLRIW